MPVEFSFPALLDWGVTLNALEVELHGVTGFTLFGVDCSFALTALLVVRGVNGFTLFGADIRAPLSPYCSSADSSLDCGSFL